MADYIIAAASTADLPAEYFKEYDIPLISYTYIIDDEPFKDDCTEETRAHTYQRMREGAMTSTSMINTYSYYTFL